MLIPCRRLVLVAHSYELVSTYYNKLQLPGVNSLRAGSRCVEFKASQLWNSLHDKLKKIRSFGTFKKHLHNQFLFEDMSG